MRADSVEIGACCYTGGVFTSVERQQAVVTFDARHSYARLLRAHGAHPVTRLAKCQPQNIKADPHVLVGFLNGLLFAIVAGANASVLVYRVKGAILIRMENSTRMKST